MNACSLILYGLIDLFFEFFGFIMAHSGGLISGDSEEFIQYGSMGLDVVKAVAVIAGFICSCIASSGLSEHSKSQMITTWTIIQWIILVPAVLMAVFIESVMINAPQHDYDFRIIAILIFFIYATLKFVTFFGFCEFLKTFIREASKADYFPAMGGFRYLPVNMYPPKQLGEQQPEMLPVQYISGYPVNNI